LFTDVTFVKGEKNMGATIRIADAELGIMHILWSEERPMTSTEIRDRLQSESQWGKSTVLTLIRRLVEKGALSCEKQERFRYAPLISEKEYRDNRTRKLIDALYGGSVRNLVVALCTTSTLTQKEREELQRELNNGLNDHE
jgi:BlaI family transcriptional regulator, penicillinase repressor